MFNQQKDTGSKLNRRNGDREPQVEETGRQEDGGGTEGAGDGRSCGCRPGQREAGGPSGSTLPEEDVAEVAARPLVHRGGRPGSYCYSIPHEDVGIRAELLPSLIGIMLMSK